MGTKRLELLIVCTANVCRSPALEVLLRDGTATHGGLPKARVRVRSAGIMARPEQATDPRMQSALTRIGVGALKPDAALLDPALHDSADLVLVATRAQRSDLARRKPAELPRLFTFAEFGRYCEAAASEIDPRFTTADARLRAVVELAGRRRGTMQPRRLDDDDVSDPFGGSARTYRRCVTRLVAVADQILAVAQR